MLKCAINTLIHSRRIMNSALKGNKAFKSMSKELKNNTHKPRKLVIWPTNPPKKALKKASISFSEPYRRIKPLNKEKKV